MIIDIHTHVCDDVALAEYRAKCPTLVDTIIAIPFFESHAGLPGFEELIAFAERTPGMYVLGTVNMDTDVSQQLARLETLFEEKKIVGIKLYPGYQHFYPSDENVSPIAELCARYKKPLVFHGGMTYCDMARSSKVKYTHPSHVDELAVRHPETPIIVSHFGFPNFMETAMVVSKNGNVYTDISGVIDELQGYDIAAMTDVFIADLTRICTYLREIESKILFGTDFVSNSTSLNQVEPYMQVVERVFSPGMREHVLGGLAEKLFFSPR